MLNDSIKRDKALSQDFQTRKILRIKSNKTREYTLKYRKKLIEIIIFVKKNFSGWGWKGKFLEKKNYLFKEIASLK